MWWFKVLFPPGMILLPIILAAACRTPKDVQIDTRRVRRLTWTLWGGTTLALVCFLLALWRWPEAHWVTVLWTFSAPLFGILMVLLPAKNPDWLVHQPRDKTRSATLVNRGRENPIGARWWALAWAVGLAGLISAAARCLASPWLPDTWPWITAVVFGVCAAVDPLMAMGAVRMTLFEPEPIDPANSAELREAYAQHRRFRAWAFYALFGLAMPLVFSLAGILVTWFRDPRMDMNLGLWGGIAGSVVGIAGAVFGTVASFRRAKIAAQLRRMLAVESLPPLQRGK